MKQLAVFLILIGFFNVENLFAQSLIVDRELVDSMIEERRALVLNEAQIQEENAKILAAKAQLRELLAVRYFEEPRLSDIHGLAAEEAIKRGILPADYNEASMNELDHAAYDLFTELKSVADAEGIFQDAPGRAIIQLVEATSRIVASLKARREIARLEAFRDRASPPEVSPHDVQVFSKISKTVSKTRMHSKGYSVREPDNTLVPTVQRASQGLDDSDMPASIAEIMQELAADAETGEILDARSFEEKLLEDAIEAFHWVIEHETGHLGDADRSHASRAAAELLQASQPDPSLLEGLGRRPSLQERLEAEINPETLRRILLDAPISREIFQRLPIGKGSNESFHRDALRNMMLKESQHFRTH